MMGEHYSISKNSFDVFRFSKREVDKIALVTEGGGQRGVFTAGVLDSFLQANFNPFDLLIGTSAGSLNLASYICGHKGHAYRIIDQVTRSPDFFKLSRFLLTGEGMDLDWLIDKTESDIPLNWKVGEEHLTTKQVLAVAAHATNFETKYFDLSTSNWKDILRASCAIPALHKQPVIMDDKRWLDGGLTTPIPVQAAYDRGFRHIVVIRTVPVDFKENHDWLISLAKMTKNSTLDHMAAMLVTHEENYRKTQAFLANPPDDVIIYEISPNKALQSKVLGSTKKQLDADYQHGKALGNLFLETIASKLSLSHLQQEQFLIQTREERFTDERKQQEYNTQIDAIWNSKICGEVLGVERIPLKWINVNPNKKKQTLVIVNGRNESYWKYKEVILELSQYYNIYAYDHRGQGESGRMTQDHELGHVDDFHDYVMDLYIFMERVVRPNLEGECFMLSHSMGAAVMTQYLSTFDHPVKASAATSPMFGVYIPGKAHGLKKQTLNLLDVLASKPNYALGQSHFKKVRYEENVLTHSKARYQIFVDLFVNNPRLRLGGPSTHWITESIKAGKKCIATAHKIKIPMLILQAGDDLVVSNIAQSEFHEKCNSSHLEQVEGAYHDMLIEKDIYRDIAINKLLDFFTSDYRFY
ncbi:alpha/beta fold hydrolase [Aliivibrio sp. S4TY2]|uniref:alpha/beta fold hydrolase n=1 Tax=unclassified Aliivibrio TaxID=2645654 RepID=UPI0023790966|nr:MULTISPECIES: alpha/beta fold hydrolase [unclassified Aliivibrio]MDD9158238.1 alpha/beta fold hydrolase [Aliivibrio sp. S4TY2]MDD9162153.1 alpha/beta fold hydrolase [Aliivibrio sp. S4TY1]MDD9166191.1 alpha/beta fold hydrolase [Aliivibrio sp. S4MY2]MDD9170189.1 alpha/beta fold hydrolase [Aliivibrio sp. S4MY4]MDD9187240.1 alpha/beta fold hydrolase [Aliivibrio sp. S4MY3]